MSAVAPLLPVAWLNVPLGWLFVGAGLALATIGIISLLRTKWRYVKPWKKCALLSLWVHILLAYVATVIQIASSGLGLGPGHGPGPPIEVALVTTEITPLDEVSSLVVEEPAEDEPAKPTPAEAEAEAPADNKPDDAEEEAEPDESADDESVDPESEPLEAPDLLPQAASVEEPKAEAAPELADETVDAKPIEERDAEPVADELRAPLLEQTAPLPPVEKPTASSVAKTHADSADAPAADSSKARAESSDNDASERRSESSTRSAPVPETYADRFAPNRSQLVAGGGGNANTERAVNAALAWLAAAQSEDGRWDAKRHGAGQERYTLGHDRGGAGAKADTGVGSLALLAFLGAGHSHREGPYSTEVARGLDFLRRSQRTNGNLYGEAELFAQMYCHSMATFAVGEAYALTKDKRLEPIVRSAVGYSLAVQHPTDGGWRYRPGDTGDTSQLGWQVMSLKSAELAGLAVPEATWTRVDRFLRRVERGQAGGLAVYRPEEALPSRPMTAEALYCRQLTTGQPDGGLSSAALDEAIGSLLKELPSTRQINLYYWYYATLALHRAHDASPQAADAWRRWNEALTTTLLSTQQEDGSWPATCVWGGYGGRVYTTALAAMSLEVYYRYAPSEEPGGGENIARREEEWK